ncbi:T-kininogen 2 [Poeciliopsis prolifica]|uniref:T-kininogen 2 n=1 Tax=Poeciliopsis prolifica TaxID=188132 RepID=UPI00072CBDE3|nr:T-kininogen 2 [Poeciliopsis prolifica]
MSLPLSLLICLSVFQLCLGTSPVEKIITAEKVNLLGSWHEKSPESKDVQRAAHHAVETFNKNSKYQMLFKLVSIQSAKSQVTNMINFKIIALLGKTKCPKTKNHDLKSCILDKGQLKCHLVVTLEPGSEKYDLKTNKCHKVVKNG